MGDLGIGWGDTMEKPRGATVTEVGGPSILSKVVAVTVVEGVEQAGGGGWKSIA
jgi:hypothetical protein